MKLTGAEKAVIAAIITFLTGLATEVALLIQQGAWTAQTTIVLVAWAVTTLGTTTGVFLKPNAPVEPAPAPDPPPGP